MHPRQRHAVLVSSPPTWPLLSDYIFALYESVCAEWACFAAGVERRCLQQLRKELHFDGSSGNLLITSCHAKTGCGSQEGKSNEIQFAVLAVLGRLLAFSFGQLRSGWPLKLR